MATKRYGVHRVYMAANQQAVQQLVEVTEGKVQHCRALTEEFPFTKWIGGVVVLSGYEQVDWEFPLDKEEVCKRLLAFPGPYGWHISAEAWACNTVTVLERLV